MGRPQCHRYPCGKNVEAPSKNRPHSPSGQWRQQQGTAMQIGPSWRQVSRGPQSPQASGGRCHFHCPSARRSVQVIEQLRTLFQGRESPFGATEPPGPCLCESLAGSPGWRPRGSHFPVASASPALNPSWPAHRPAFPSLLPPGLCWAELHGHPRRPPPAL